MSAQIRIDMNMLPSSQLLDCCVSVDVDVDNDTDLSVPVSSGKLSEGSR